VKPTPADRETSNLTRRELLRGAGVAGLAILAPGEALRIAHAAIASEDHDSHGMGSMGSGGMRATTSSRRLGGTIRGTHRVDGAHIEGGRTLRFDPDHDTTLVLSGNLVVMGRLEMHPKPGVEHVIRFVNVDEAAFVGGGMDVLDSDVGLWVMDRGVLDIEGTKRDAWNRSGDHPTWKRHDELVVAPVERGDLDPKPFRRGHHVPSFHGHRAEVLNLTRNVRIEGTPGHRAHVFIHSMRPQSIKYATLRYLGPRQVGGGSTVPVLGRYGLHFHHGRNGTKGTIVEGVVARDLGNHAFVPHMSHGITFRDCISYNTFEDAYWWDENDASDDITIDRCVAAAVHFDPDVQGYNLAGFVLGLGTGLRMRGCAAFSVFGNRTSSGFSWPEALSGLWRFTNNTAHNNAAAGIFVWQNNREPHKIENFTSYNDGLVGVLHGAYINAYHYDGLDIADEPVSSIELRAGGRDDPRGHPQSWTGVEASNLVVKGHNLPGESPVLFRNCRFRNGVSMQDAEADPAPLDFVDCALRPSDFDTTSMHPDTVIRVQRPNGSAYKITSTGVTRTHRFYPYR
jgi:hypothetical protein